MPEPEYLYLVGKFSEARIWGLEWCWECIYRLLVRLSGVSDVLVSDLIGWLLTTYLVVNEAGCAEVIFRGVK